MTGISTSLTIKDRFTNTLNRGAASVDRMLKSMKAAPAAMQGFNKKQTEVAQGAEKIKSAWIGIGTLVRTALGYFGLQKAVQAIDTYTNNSARLGLITDSLEKQKALQEDIYKAAQRSRGSYNGMVDTVSKLGLLAGDAFSTNGVLNTKELVAFSELMQKSFAISGASSQEQEAGLYQLTQAMAAGRLQGDEFRSIMENAPMLADAISKYTGKSKGELKEMSAEGTITADIIKAALFSAADDIEGKFNNMPRTFASTWTQIANYATMKFGGVMETINGFLNSATGTAMIGGITAAISFLADAVAWLINAIAWVGNAVAANWGIIEPILIAAGAILAAWAYTMIPGLIAKLWAMVPPILTSAGAWLAMNWPILLVALGIAAVIIILKKMGVTFDQVCGFVGGVIGGLYAYMYNIVAGMYNYWASFIEFFANCFNHPVYSIKKLFVNLANIVLDIVKSIAEAIDAVFGSNMAGGVESLQSQMDAWVGEMPDGYKVVEKMEMKSIGDYAKNGYNVGAKIGAGISDTVGGLFSGTDGLTDGLATAMNGIDINSVGEVGKINTDVNIADEDIKLMKDVAEMRYVQNFVTLDPTISMSATVTKDADFDAFYDQFSDRVAAEFEATAEDYYS